MNAMLGHLAQAPILTLSDHAAASIGAKIFFADPTLYTVLSGQEGNAREAYVVSALRDGIDWPAPGILPLWTLGFMS